MAKAVEQKEKTADFLIQELYKKKLKNFSKKWNTRESKVNLKKETSQNNYDFTNFGKRKVAKKINKKEIEKNKKIIKILDDEYMHFEKMAEVIDKAKGLEALERVDIIDRMLKEVSSTFLISPFLTSQIPGITETRMKNYKKRIRRNNSRPVLTKTGQIKRKGQKSGLKKYQSEASLMPKLNLRNTGSGSNDGRKQSRFNKLTTRMKFRPSVAT